MSAIKASLLWLLCAVDVALGAWLASVFVMAARTSGTVLVLLQNLGHVALTACLLGLPVLCISVRGRASPTRQLALAAAPLALFLALGGKLSLRWA